MMMKVLLFVVSLSACFPIQSSFSLKGRKNTFHQTHRFTRESSETVSSGVVNRFINTKLQSSITETETETGKALMTYPVLTGQDTAGKLLGGVVTGVLETDTVDLAVKMMVESKKGSQLVLDKNGDIAGNE